MNAADCVIGPLQYSTASLCLAHSVKFLYVKQSKLVDEPFISALLERHNLGVEMSSESYESGNWAGYLRQLESQLQPAESRPTYRSAVLRTCPVLAFDTSALWIHHSLPDQNEAERRFSLMLDSAMCIRFRQKQH